MVNKVALPHIGQAVIYMQGANEKPHNGTYNHPAIITRVWGNNTVNLMVLPDSGIPYAVGSVCMCIPNPLKLGGMDVTPSWAPTNRALLGALSVHPAHAKHEAMTALGKGVAKATSKAKNKGAD